MDSDPAGALGNQSAEQDLCPHSKKVKPLKNRRISRPKQFYKRFQVCYNKRRKLRVLTNISMCGRVS